VITELLPLVALPFLIVGAAAGVRCESYVPMRVSRVSADGHAA
jgi:hypothetical protein